MPLTLDRISVIEKQLERTDKEIDAHIRKYFPTDYLMNQGDTANIVKILHMQAECVEALAEEKRKLNG